MTMQQAVQSGQSPLAPHGVPFPVVGIGASAGRYAALITLLQNMPSDSGMAFVVILHLASDEPSAADKLLQRASAMPVVQVTHTMPILPDHVYVIPPDRSLAMHDGHLVLDQLDRSRGRPVAIDLFLRTLAQAHMEHAIGIVLSGMGSDGTAGLACIKETGGVTIVQLPQDAQEGGMPRAAIESGMADFVLPAAAIPHKLLALRDSAHAMRRQAAHAQPAGRPGPPCMRCCPCCTSAPATTSPATSSRCCCAGWSSACRFLACRTWTVTTNGWTKTAPRRRRCSRTC